jgi:hypothetical protein
MRVLLIAPPGAGKGIQDADVGRRDAPRGVGRAAGAGAPEMTPPLVDHVPEAAGRSIGRTGPGPALSR